MTQPPTDFHPRSRQDLRWIASNIALALIGVALVAAEWFSITAQQTETIGKENRFLTTEWYLLQQLRAQTDAELTRKNQEIESLKQLYEQLKAGNNSTNDLDKVEAQLKAAENIREEMLTQSVKSGLHPSLSAVMPSEASTGQESGTDLRQSQAILLLQQQVDELRARAETAEAAVVDLKRQQPGRTAIPLSRALETLENGKASLGPVPQPTVAELKTKALIRAILSSSDVKKQYPELLGAFDGYLDSYGTREYARGRVTGYTEAAQSVRDLNQ